MIAVNYTILFKITFLHDYFDRPEDALRGLKIEPDGETKRVLKRNRLLYKIEKNELLCFIPTPVQIDSRFAPAKIAATKDTPLIPWDDKEKVRFEIFNSDGSFPLYTNLKIFGKENKIYRFANTSGNFQGVDKFLSRPVPAYNATVAYEMGTLVVSGGNFYESIKYNDPLNTAAPADVNHWSPLSSTGQVVNQEDLNYNWNHNSCLGLIEILFDNNIPNDFSILKNNKIRDGGQQYKIHFRNRSTYWNYNFDPPAKAWDKNGIILFNPAVVAASVRSVKPIPLTEKGLKSILKNDITAPIPSADPRLLKFDPQPPTIASKLISEIVVTEKP
jgi:hypothetical protein